MNRVKSVKGKKIDIGREIRHLGVKIESTDHKFDLIAEQYGDIKKTLDVHTKMLESHSEMIGELSVNMQIVKRDIEIMKADIEFIKQGLKKKVDADEFSSLERRVAVLERRRS